MSNNPKVIVDELTATVFKTVMYCFADATDKSSGKISAKEEVKTLLQRLWDKAFCHGQEATRDSITNHMEKILG